MHLDCQLDCQAVNYSDLVYFVLQNFTHPDMSPSAIHVEVPPRPQESSIPKSKQASIVRPSYEIREEPIHSRRPLRIVCLGAGYSGVLMGIIYDQRMQGRKIDLTIYERNETLGGTWYENT